MSARASAERPLFDAEFHRTTTALERFARRLLAGDRPGGGEVPRRGLSGTLFHDYRNYVSGDDPRRIDWHVYGRLGELVIKLFEAEARYRVHVIVDATPSMSVENLSHKWWMARRLAGGLCQLGLHLFEGVRLIVSPGSGEENARLHRGKAQLPVLLDRLSTATERVGHLGKTLEGLPPAFATRDAVVILSDLYDLEELDEALKRIGRRAARLSVVQVIDSSDTELPGEGWHRLRDIETGRDRVVRVTPELRLALEETLSEHSHRAEILCRRRGARRVHVETTLAFAPALLRTLESLR